MASSSSLLLHQNPKPLSFHLLPTSAINHGGSLPLLGRTNGFASPRLRAAKQRYSSRGSNKKFVVRSDGSPESAAATDLLSSIPIPGLKDNPWAAAIAGVVVVVPFMIQRILTLTKEVDLAAGTVEKIADTVGKVADRVDKVAEELSESMPEGKLRDMVDMVENLAEDTSEGAEKVEELMVKVDELTDRIDDFVTQKPGETEKA